ncbi:uncharacterized protein LOC106870725 isoform X1 [Octopus bimaculoides]|uniref:Uncharacterized protein n=1 Tax=Octopus bimaculoides TaxID=37653 RepID=A0A0L8HI82_OCTBM|nr:uncharacterized protein LOC106870725 isoform X1 [Octopus bimaculoides]|eukprot:XP_014772381.1 PREDICTED: uncharacterized protein LOC106870725 isoform X1 [Octopus bimaculoides]
MIKVKLHTTCVNNHLPLCRLLHHLQTHQHQRFSGGKFLRLLWLPLEIAKCKNSHTIAAKIPLEENASKKLDILPLKMILFVERYLSTTKREDVFEWSFRGNGTCMSGRATAIQGCRSILLAELLNVTLYVNYLRSLNHKHALCTLMLPSPLISILSDTKRSLSYLVPGTQLNCVCRVKN